MKGASRLVALLGALGLGLFLWRKSPRDVVLVYDLSGVGAPRNLEVVLWRGGEELRRAEFPAPRDQVRHELHLPDGRYRVDYRIDAPGGPVQGEKELTVDQGGTIVLSLGP
ncbi:MAG TPA: hypothetical protein VMU15_09710 [Anaeromyxobacter sp.]|nr:hypothetical protein [Anaeromyxobacter sp.]